MQTVDMDTILKALEIISIVGSAGALMYRLGRTTQKFEQVGAQQASEISQLKVAIEKMGTLAVVTARQDERMNAMDQRMLTQGQRIDEFQRTFFRILKGAPVGE